MTKTECAGIISILRLEYTRDYKNIDSATIDGQIQLWHTMLQDLDIKLVQLCIQKHFSSKDGMFKPSIAHIRKYASEITNGQEKDSFEEWAEVLKAVKRYGYIKENEALNSLNETTREAVNSIGYKEICLSENIDIIRAHFYKAYNSISSRKKEYNQMPLKLRKIQEKANLRLENKINEEQEVKKIETVEVKDVYKSKAFYNIKSILNIK